MQLKAIVVLLAAVALGLTLSSPIPGPKSIAYNHGFVPMLAIGDELYILDQPAEMFFVQSPASEEKHTEAKTDADCKDCESKDDEKEREPLERSFFFKNWFHRPAPVSAVTLVQPAPPPPVVRVPSPVVVGTVYQPVSLVTGLTPPIATGGIFTGTGLPSPFTGLVGQQGVLSGSRPILQIARPQPSFGFLPASAGLGSAFGGNIQQTLRPFGEIQQGISAPVSSSSFASASASVVSASSSSNPVVQQGSSGGVEQQNLETSHLGPAGTSSLIDTHKRPFSIGQQASIDKVIDIMGQMSKS